MKTYSDDNIDEILDRCEQLLDYMTDKYTTVRVGREDFHFPQSGYEVDGKNKEIGLLRKRVKIILDKKGVEVVDLWARERETKENQHYHLAILADGSKVKSLYKIKTIYGKEWDKIVNGKETALAHYCDQKKNGIKKPGEVMLRQPSNTASEELKEQQARELKKRRGDAEYMMSYLAKRHSKEDDLPKGTRRFGSSQIVTAQKKQSSAGARRSKPNQE